LSEKPRRPDRKVWALFLLGLRKAMGWTQVSTQNRHNVLALLGAEVDAIRGAIANGKQPASIEPVAIWNAARLAQRSKKAEAAR
jgi:hypothetical protein